MTARLASRTLQQFHDLARRHGLPPEAAQQMMAIHDGHMEGLTQHHRALQAHWARQAGGDPATLRAARDAVARFGGESLKQALNATGAGDHPEIVRFCARVGQALPNGTARRTATGSYGEIFYPKHQTKG